MNRTFVEERIAAVIEDTLGRPVSFQHNNELEAFFEPEEFCAFQRLLAEEFDLRDESLVEQAQTFYELILLIEDELFR
jgi:hypothetical protein